MLVDECAVCKGEVRELCSDGQPAAAALHSHHLEHLGCRYPDLYPGNRQGRIVPDDEMLNGRAWVEEQIGVLARNLGIVARLHWEEAIEGSKLEHLRVEVPPGTRSSVRVPSRLLQRRIDAPGEWAIVRVELLAVFRSVQDAGARPRSSA